MIKTIKIGLKILVAVLLIIIVGGTIGWFYTKSTFLNFEKEYIEKKEFSVLTDDGYTFQDRNDNGKLDIYEDDRLPIDQRVEDVLSKMTLEEKIHLLKGSGIASGLGMVKPGEGIPGAVGTIVPTPRLGLPTIYLSDGPAGLRIEPKRQDEERTYYCTAFPIATLLASTWNTELAAEVGDAMGTEAKEYGIDVILGPGANIHRHPFCGRNFEYFSEDPVLTGLMGAAIVNGIESNGIGTSVKHFVANNQETNRNFNDAIISERALREIYLKGFEIIIKESHPSTIMSSYNKVNGTYTSESPYLLTEILRKDWGFEGVVMSDWFGGQDAPDMIAAGNDLIEPGTKSQWKALIKAQKNGTLSESEIDTSVRRLLKLIFSSRKMKNLPYDNNPDLDAHAEIARQCAAEGMVLLKNEDALPFKLGQNVALFGVTSFDFIAGGTGSGDVNEAYSVSLKEGLENSGFRINKQSLDIYNKHKAEHAKEFIKPKGIKAMFIPYDPPDIIYKSEELNQMAENSDVGIITIGRNSGEGGDRKEKDDFQLTSGEIDLISKTCEVFHEVGKKVLVVLNIGGVIETASWKDLPDAILLAWQGGQEGGNSAASVISGQATPSGKLPMTFPIKIDDHASNANFPLDGSSLSITDMIFAKEVEESKKVRNKDYTIYEEGIYVGYRHFDTRDLEVSYPFGYGLSYTSFDYSDMSAIPVEEAIQVELTVSNVGDYPGKEAVQFYVSKYDSGIDRPSQELKSFAKTKELVPGDSVKITVIIPTDELRYWDENTNGWQLERGNYIIKAGASSRDIKLTQEIEI